MNGMNARSEAYDYTLTYSEAEHRPLVWSVTELEAKRVTKPAPFVESSFEKASASTKHHSNAAAPRSNPNVTNNIAAF